MERPRLVASDVDGTLLDPTERISPRTKEAVHRVIAAGIPFVLVTGRPPRWVPPVIEQLGHAGLAICANGAVVYDTADDHIRSSVTLSPAQLQSAAEGVSRALPAARLAVELPGVSALADEADQFLAEPDYIHPWPPGSSEAAPRDVLLSQPAIKMLVRLPGANSDQMAAAIRAVVGNELDITFSTRHGLVELSAPGVTKGSGLARVAEELGVAQSEVVAFGDMPNDLPMLQWAGCGVAMANAHPLLLEVADEVTAPNTEDGLALVLERWF